MSATIKLRSGSYFDLANPSAGQFTLSDIAGALSKICRFGGHCKRFYSVAEHCVHCANVAEDDGLSVEHRRAVLLHDATEAFCGDVVKPLKNMLPEYSAIEERVKAAIAEKFGVDFDEARNNIRQIDLALLIAERDSMFNTDGVTWTGEADARKLRVEFRYWTPRDAEAGFMLAAKGLGLSDDDHLSVRCLSAVRELLPREAHAKQTQIAAVIYRHVSGVAS